MATSPIPSTAIREPSSECVDLVAHFEGYADKPYRDTGDLWTGGFGHLLSPKELELVNRSPRTRAQWLLVFFDDLKIAGDVVAKHVTAPLAPHEFDALRSFVFNVGPGRKGVRDGFAVLRNGQPSTLLKHLNAERRQAAADQILVWNKGTVLLNGAWQQTVLPGLDRRRHAEYEMFMGRTWRTFAPNAESLSAQLKAKP